ncbi:long-chain fatty acid--CoA ligase [Deinococcus soli (ex Cha et al. 2016)]|uniref:Long-chain acyl-CoA synthetase n=2 Tax=Deinococcus soli (ex Cha et al. 2016) TaxID=1309411 RepID=A0A0F7JN80_9DEIO|nr:long-chain fatty acid--CoA ligase [Deinococcus soli (ex Cha et al. 2016)]AKH17851.1 long-chain fatty acid--CoA ligase [Deinococcus soli (ex Cha et al. 2016)]MDR6220270.1 long-chain acyl-CoA synthetase [Deinococcus soli (ex Cha et al. 2016)]MDR6330125.1 long-chain acyl-CoA synthetase [Deinococcus soli (ex Cha et al. 2016)]MDR6752923.1 long-chain acyl-CoA synthetase [Deinococcus soli (ex Cha et al. 2016)]GGB59691.1 long-chain-fatty-acid--CoA ligase [Deinococcus soli (ex Cha et al. 2016)]
MTQPALSQPWLAHYEAGVPHTFRPSGLTLPQLLERTAQKYPDRVALSFVGATTSYRDLWQQVQRFASGLQKMGVQPGDRVSIMLPNTPQFVVAFYGTLLAGAVAVNTSPMYTPSELEHQLQDSGSETLVIFDSFYPRYAEIQSRVNVRRVLVTGVQDALSFPKNLLYPVKAKREGTWVNVPFGERVLSMRKVIASQTPTPQPVTLNADDVALLQYTGGTTGVPKGAMLTHGNLVSNCEQARCWMTDLREGQETTLASIPFFHVYGMTVAMNLSVLIGATIVLIPNPRDLPMTLKAVQQTRATLFPAVPTLYNAINNHPDTPKYDLTSIRACISGSAPLLIETARKFREITNGANLVEGYGLTEASPCTHTNPIYGEQREGSIGIPFPGVHAIVVGDDGQMVAPGEVGELWIAGPMIMKGYWQKPDETAKTLVQAHGLTWLMTGDMATMDPDGYFRIVDRKKDLIIAGGFNIYPREVEEALISHPAVLEAAAVGLPDAYRGESVHAVVALKPGATATEGDIIAHCREILSAYKVPRSVEFRAELPKTAAMKILRRQLAQEARDAQKAKSA